jgi:hypothetical protein
MSHAPRWTRTLNWRLSTGPNRDTVPHETGHDVRGRKAGGILKAFGRSRMSGRTDLYTLRCVAHVARHLRGRIRQRGRGRESFSADNSWKGRPERSTRLLAQGDLKRVDPPRLPGESSQVNWPRAQPRSPPQILPACRARVLRLTGQEPSPARHPRSSPLAGREFSGSLAKSQAPLATQDPPRLPGESSQVNWPRARSVGSPARSWPANLTISPASGEDFGTPTGSTRRGRTSSRPGSPGTSLAPIAGPVIQNRKPDRA